MTSQAQTSARSSPLHSMTGRLRYVSFYADNAAALGLVALVVVFSILTPDFLTLGNIRAMLAASAILVILSVAHSFVITTGGIDLSISATMTVGASCIGLAWQAGLGLLPAVLIGIGASSAMGLVNGFLIAKGQAPDFIVTLGTMSAGTGLALIMLSGKPIPISSPELLSLTTGSVGIVGYPVLLAVSVAVVAWCVLFRTRFGLHVQAIGGNEEAARANSVRAVRVRIAVYVLGGALAGLAAILVVARIGSAEPVVNQAYLLNSIAAVVLGGVSLSGGRGSIVGPVIGAVLLTGLTNGLTLVGSPHFYQPVAVGAVVVLAALLTRYQKR